MPTDKLPMEELIEELGKNKALSPIGVELLLHFAHDLLAKEKALMNECRGEGFDKGFDFGTDYEISKNQDDFIITALTKEQYLSQYIK